MRLSSYLYTPLFLAGIFSASVSLGQGRVVDTVEMPVPGKFAKENDLFFDAIKAKAHNDNKHAAELFEQFVSSNPGSAAAYYELSRLYFEEKKFQKAEDNIVKATGIVKDNKWYNEHYAAVLSAGGKFEKAARIMAEVSDREPSEVNYAIAAAEYFEKAQKYTEAIAYIDKAVVRSGSADEILVRKARLYLAMNQVDKAAEVGRQLIKQDPSNGRYYKFLAEVYDGSKMPQKALEVYKEAERKIPDDPAIQLGLQDHYLSIKDSVNYRIYARKVIGNPTLDVETQVELFEAYIQTLSDSQTISEGKPLLKQLMAQHPNQAPLIAIYGRFLEAGHQLDSAAAEYKHSLAIKPGNFSVWQDLLSVYSGKTFADSLIKYSEKAIRLFPNQALAHYYNGVGHYNKKNFPKAVNSVKRAIDLIPDTDGKMLASMHSFLAEIFNSGKQFDESDKAFEKALELVPNDATVLNNYAYYLSERGKNLDKAKKMSERSLEIRPNEATFFDTYGWILYKNGDFQKAREYVEKAVAANEKTADATLYEHLAAICFKLNDKTKAVQYWKLAREKGSENPLLTKMISEEKLYE